VEAANKRAAEAEARATEGQRKLVLHEAGLADLTERQVKALYAAHDGEVNVDSLKATATELFGGATPAPQAQQAAPVQQPDTGLAAQEQFAAGGTTVEPPKDGDTEYVEKLKNWTGTKAELDDFIWNKNSGRLTP
jgi:hypothetical protein